MSYGLTGTRKYGRVNVEITKEKKPKRIYTKVEITGAHPGGDSSLIQSLEQMLEQSIKIKNKAKAGKYFVSVAFLLEGDGSVTDIRCVNDPGFGMCEQVVTVIKRNFPRKWGAQIDSSGKVRRYHTTFATLHDQ